MKYQYIMCGMVDPTNGELYEINIPSPFLYDSEEEAKHDSGLSYRFCMLDKNEGPLVVIFGGEDYELAEENGQKYLKTWVTGNVLKTYTYDEFKAAGGYIRKLKPEFKNCGFIDSDTDFLDTDETFTDIFPNIVGGKLYYIDNEAYCIMPIKEESTD